MAKDLVRTRRHIHKFYQMKTQLQAVSLRIQTLRSNQQMAEAMKGATRVSLSFFASCSAAPPRKLTLLCDSSAGHGNHESQHEPAGDPAHHARL